MSSQILDEALLLTEELLANRYYIHQHAEAGIHQPETKVFFKTQLEKYGCEPRDISGGVYCLIGSGSPVLMLRADMDALPQQETTGLPYACTTGACHAAGMTLIQPCCLQPQSY